MIIRVATDTCAERKDSFRLQIEGETRPTADTSDERPRRGVLRPENGSMVSSVEYVEISVRIQRHIARKTQKIQRRSAGARLSNCRRATRRSDRPFLNAMIRFIDNVNVVRRISGEIVRIAEQIVR